MSVFTKSGSIRVTIRHERRIEPAEDNAALDRPDVFPLSREFKRSAPKIASDMSSGAATNSHPDFAASPAINVEAIMAIAISRLGVRFSQDFRVIRCLQDCGRSFREKYGLLFFMTSKRYQ
jgi:hypothetical protein